MYSKHQASQWRQEFWTTFGLYMAPILSSEGEKINWINYKTGVKNIFFKMEADNKLASIRIEITHPDQELQKIYFDQFGQLKNIFYKYVQEEWRWLLHTPAEHGKIISSIETSLAPVNIFAKEDWPRLISFFKPRMIALDAYWCDVKYSFEMLP